VEHPARSLGTRGEILSRLCAAPQTATQLSEALDISRNSVREQLLRLADEGLIQHDVVRRGVGKPAHEYRLTLDGEVRLSRAYLPLLNQLLRVVEARLGPEETEAALRAAGRGLAPPGRAEGDLVERVAAAIEFLRGLGGFAVAEQSEGRLVIRCTCCAIGAVVTEHPLACRGMASLLEDFVGTPVRERCDRSARPECRFELDARGIGASGR
jgi:predicted ArsR family transcriptional regulator